MKRTAWLHYIKVRHLVFCLSLFALSLCFGTTLFAQSTRPCSDEIARFCKDVKAGRGNILSCLHEHESDLSATCRKKLGEVKKRSKEAKEACGADIEKFCSGIEPGAGRIAKCLRASESELSPACRQKIQRMSRKKQKATNSAQ